MKGSRQPGTEAERKGLMAGGFGLGPLLGSVLAGMTGFGALLAGTDVRKPPNLLVIVTDNQPWWAMGCTGNEIISTPQLDRLAREGVRFRNAFVTTPVCAASRASLFTGLYRGRHGFTFNTPPFRAALAAASYPARLRQAGYRTALIGKFGIESNGTLMVEGGQRSLDLMFDHFDHFEHWGKSGPKGYFVTGPDGKRRHL
ncbi:MAG: sulfatase-like hydrolase/transferase, partial [Akkermansiaceae bacterium]|nr:sulfatase-like hydrolase/transferase [Akkermansiaceae bacterium]